LETQLTTAPSHIAPATGKKSNNRLRAILLILILLLGVLLYLYWFLTKPPTPVDQPRAKGINWIFSIYGWGNHRLDSPDGVAFDKNGNIYVSDTGNNRGVAFDSNGKFRFVFGARTIKYGLQKHKLMLPLGLTVDPKNGDIYVAQMVASKITVFNKKGKWLRDIPSDRPIKVKIFHNNLYVTTPGSIWIMTKKGKRIKQWGLKGHGVGEFEYPNGIDMDKKGNLFISDSENNRLQIFNKKGKLVGGIGAPTSNMNQSQRLFGFALGLAIDNQQMVYVVDAFHHAIRVFDHNGKDLGELGIQGSNDGEFNYPSDITYRGGRAFAIADKWNDRIQIVNLTPANVAGGVAAAPAGVPIYIWVILFLLLLLIIILLLRRYLANRAEQRQAA